MRPLTILLTAVLSLGFAPVPFPKPDSRGDDLKALQGSWERVSLTRNGAPQRQARGGVVATFIDEQVCYGSPSDVWDFKLDATRRPKRIDSSHATDPTLVFRGVYRLDGDTLTVCWREAKADAGRATGFDPKQPNVWLYVYRRVKP